MKKISQAIVLAGGKGTRLWPLTETKPKPFLEVCGKTILERKLDILTSFVKEVILVIGPKGEIIVNSIGQKYKNLKIRYVWQKEPKGTADALLRAEKFLEERFLLLYGDDIYVKDDIKACLKKFPSLAVIEVEDPSPFGIIIPEKDYVKDFIEKPKGFDRGLVSMGILCLPKSILKEKIKKSKRGEYELPDLLRVLMREKKLYFVKAKKWLPISYPWHLLDANETFLEKQKRKIEGKIEKNCQIFNSVVVKKGTIIKSGTYIEGPVLIGENCQIGPNCYIRKFTTIGKNCRIGQAVEIKNSIIKDNTKISHLSYVGDSIIGENCLLGAGTICANVRFDGKTIKTKVKGKLIDTKRKKFGCVIGDNTKTGINASLMPGILIGTNCIVYPGTVVFKNLKKENVFKGKYS